MVRFFVLFVFLVFCALSSDAHRRELVKVSMDTNNIENAVIIEQKIGNADFQKFGKLIIEKKGSKFYLTFPFFLYMNSLYYYSSADDTIRVGTTIYLALSDGEIIKSKTDRNTDFILHYLWRYNSYEAYDYPNLMALPSFRSYTWYDYNKIPVLDNDENYYNVCGTSWAVKFEFTPSDMLALSKNRILNAHSIKSGQIVFIPIKKKQSKKIKKAISSLLRN